MNRLALFIFLISCIGTIQGAGQNISQYDYKYLDSVGILNEKVVIPLDSTTFVIPTRSISGAPAYLDSVSLNKIDYLSNLIQEDSQVALVILLYDDFYLNNNYQVYGEYMTYFRAKRIIRKVLREGVEPLSIQFYYPSILDDYMGEELHSIDRRLEFLIYELPDD